MTSTDTLIQIALEMANLESLPEDSAVYVPGNNIQRILFALDVGAAELLMAKQLGYDCVIAHHPVGVAYQSWRVFDRHIDQMVSHGVPHSQAVNAVSVKRNTLKLGGMTQNYERVTSVAQHLQIPFLNIHCPLDEVGRRVMQEAVSAASTNSQKMTVNDIVNLLSALPEAKNVAAKPQQLMGEGSAAAGRVVVSHGALTNGGYDIANAYFESGINTVAYIHIQHSELVRLRSEAKGNLVVTGHLLGDAVGITPYITALRNSGLTVDVLGRALEPAV
ncbi:MAG: hypothetical protein ABFQ89_04715 [Chloroflexota bacterium]